MKMALSLPPQADMVSVWQDTAICDRLRAAPPSARAAVLLFLHERPGLRSVLSQDSPQLPAAFQSFWKEVAETPAHLACQVLSYVCVSNLIVTMRLLRLLCTSDCMAVVCFASAGMHSVQLQFPQQ